MADRPNKRARRQISEDSTDSLVEEDNKNYLSSERKPKTQPSTKGEIALSPSNTMSRPRRAMATPASINVNPSTSVTVSRSPSDSPEEERRRSIKLTVKMPSSKLREVTSQASIVRNISVNSRDTFEAGEIMTGKRSTRAKDRPGFRTYNESDDPDPSEEESEESEDQIDSDLSRRKPKHAPNTSDEEGNEEDEDEEDDDDDENDEEEGGAGEEDSDDEDEETEGAPSPSPYQATSRIKLLPLAQPGPGFKTKSIANPAVIVTPAAAGPAKSAQKREADLENDEDEELSELESNVEDDEQDETMIDAQGDEEEHLGVEEDAEGDEDIDAEGEVESDDDTPGSGAGTPKQQTKRQRGQDEGAFLALPMEPQIKKILTADEHRMRRAEMARRRKNLSEKRNEEEKMSTINRLLKRQVPKRRGKAMNPETLEAATAAEGASSADVEEMEVERANPLFVRYINNKDGARIGVPEEWLGKKVGRLFGPAPPSNGNLIEEVA